ncbi:D-aspartate oxidase-like [Lycorma delicatula]|uniref:D-aspartate oxidase-like n=1 Tax=Lycorma delicatula TaxID=130591 RepID=UPI003F517A1D
MGVLKVGVLGAGIVGLVSAEEVVKTFPSADVTIIADKFLMDTTSDGAAGLFMPVLYNFSAKTDDLTREIIKESYEYYSNFINKNCGVTEAYGFLLSDTTKEVCYSDMLSTILPIYRDATEEELLEYPGNWRYGTYVKTLITKGRNFMPSCLKRLKESGVKVIKKTVQNINELENKFDVVINCSGIGAAELFNDTSLVPLRGQIVKARSPEVDKFILAGEETYIIPYGHGVSTLGGTHQLGHYDTAIRKHDTQGILNRCSALLPQLKNTQILWEWAGLRPYRHSVRIEKEKIRKLKVIHNYGHGGVGVSTAPGTSKYAVLLMEEMLKNSKL